MIEIVRYLREDGSEPYTEWYRALRDGVAKAAVAMRLRRVEQGNFGDCKSVGEGVRELRIQVGPGYRVYFGQHDQRLVILLCAGDKSHQSSDIVRAKAFFGEWKRRQP